MGEHRGSGEADRRASRQTRTVMFVDRVDSTVSRAALGDERADRLQRKHDRLVNGAVLRNDGEIVKHTGDGLLAVFTSAASALAAAVDAQRVISRHRGSGDETLAIRIGMSTGDVLFEHGDYFGLTVVEAQRLEASAKPGQIRCADLVLQVARGTAAVTARSLGPLELKGLPEPVPSSVVEWESGRTNGRSVRELQPILHVPTEYELVGRERELGQLEAALEQVVDLGDFGLVLIAGEPGIGKTRLAMELAEGALDHGVLVLAGHADERLEAAYQPVVDALRWYVERVYDPGRPETLGSNPRELAALAQDLFDEFVREPAPARSAASPDRAVLFDAVASWLAHAGGDHPTCLVLDDLHWADDETALLVEHIVRRRPSRLLVVITYRDTEIVDRPLLRRLVGDIDRAHVLHLRLDGLSAADVGRLASSSDPNADRSTFESLHAQTNGNPLFVSEYLRHLDRGGDAPGTGPPSSVREIIRRRVEWVGSDAAEALAIASVVGVEFDLRTLGTVSELGSAAVFQLLARACDGRLLEETDVGWYRFSHPLIRSSLYESMSRTRRAHLHASIAEAIEAIPEDEFEDRLAQLVRHWREAAPLVGHARAVAHSLEAGRVALDRYAPLAAAAHFEYAARHHPDPTGRAEATLATGLAQLRAGVPRHRETLLAAARLAVDTSAIDVLARALVASGRWGYTTTSEPDHEKIAALEDAIARISDDRPDLRSDLLAALAMELVFEGQGVRRAKLCNEAVLLASTCGNAAVQASVSVRVLQVMPFSGQSAVERGQLVDTTRLGIAAARSAGDDELVVRTLNNGFFTFMTFGLIEEAMSCAGELRALADRTGDPFTRRHVDMFDPVLALLAGDVDASSVRSREALQRWTADDVPEAAGFWAVERFAIARERGQLGALAVKWNHEVGRPAAAGISRAMHAVAATATESVSIEAALSLIEPAAADNFASVPDDAVWLVTVTLWAEASVAAEHHAAVDVLGAILTPWAGCLVVTGGLFLGAVDRVLGLLAASRGDVETARARLVTADAIHRVLGSPVWIARSQLDRVAVELRAGELAAARALLDDLRDVVDLSRLPEASERFQALSRQALDSPGLLAPPQG